MATGGIVGGVAAFLSWNLQRCSGAIATAVADYLLGKPRLCCSRRIHVGMPEQKEKHATALLDVVGKDMLIATAKFLLQLQMRIDQHVKAFRTRGNGSEWIYFAAVEDGWHGDEQTQAAVAGVAHCNRNDR